MLNEDFVQTHNNSQESSPEPVLMHTEFEGSNNNNSSNESFNYPSSPKPTGVIVSTNTTTNVKKSYHTFTSIANKRRQTKKKIIDLHSPPQNRLAFINAVKMAWSLQIKRGKRKLQNNKKIIINSVTSATSDISIVKNKLDYPPITAEALSELSVSQLFKSLQIRHDLLIDPNLTFRPNLTAEKTQESETYWKRLDHLIKFCSTHSTTEESDDHYQLIFLVRNLLTELSLILISLISPFPSHPTTSFIWNWPQQITESYILSVLDPDLIHQQLIQGCLNVDFKFGFLYSVLDPLCPEQANKVQKLAQSNEYARALEVCFLTLETIKLVSDSIFIFFLFFF